MQKTNVHQHAHPPPGLRASSLGRTGTEDKADSEREIMLSEARELRVQIKIRFRSPVPRKTTASHCGLGGLVGLTHLGTAGPLGR